MNEQLTITEIMRIREAANVKLENLFNEMDWERKDKLRWRRSSRHRSLSKNDYRQKGHLTAALTWGETATDKLRENTQRDKKVAVSPSRPLICSALRL